MGEANSMYYDEEVTTISQMQCVLDHVHTSSLNHDCCASKSITLRFALLTPASGPQRHMCHTLGFVWACLPADVAAPVDTVASGNSQHACCI